MTMLGSHIACEGASLAQAQRGGPLVARLTVLLSLADLGLIDARHRTGIRGGASLGHSNGFNCADIGGGEGKDGKAGVGVPGMTELQPGHFIGSISYVTEETAPANVVALEPTRYVSWSKAKLKEFMSKNAELHSTRNRRLAST